MVRWPTRVFSTLILDALDRAEAGVDRNHADLQVVGVALGGRPVAAAVLDGHLQVERHVIGQGAEDVVGVDDLDRFVVQDVGGRDDAAAIAVDPDRPGVLGVVLDHQELDVEHEIGDVVDHAGDRRELVLHALDLDLGDRAALQAGEQDPPQAVAHGVAEAAFERLDVELAEGVGQGLAVADDPAGQFEATPTDTHHYVPPKNRSTGHDQRLNNSMINCGVTGSEISWVDGMRVTRPSGGSVPMPVEPLGNGGSCPRPGCSRPACASARGS